MSECLIDKRLIKVVDSIRVLYPNVSLHILLCSPLAAEVQQKKVEASRSSYYNSFAHHRDLHVISRLQ